MAATATKKKKSVKSSKNVSTRFTARAAAAIAAAAAVLGVKQSDANKIVDRVRKVLMSLGKAEQRNGRTTVFANNRVLFTFAAAKHVKNAVRRADNNCPIAQALKDSFLSNYVTHVHVGNHTVKVWSVLCPDVVVKFSLSPALYAAVRAWDEKGRWTIEDGIYALYEYPRSLRPGHVPQAKRESHGPHTRSASRKITLQSDIGAAMAMAAAGKKINV